MLVQRLGGELAADAVHRWCYAADIVRQPNAAREPTECHQVGVELLGDGDAWADVELVALADAALRACGLADFRLDLAHAQLARDAVAKLGLDEDTRLLAHGLLARKHTVGLARLLVERGVPDERASAVASLCDRVGGPAIVERAREQLGALVDRAQLGALAAVCEGLQTCGEGIERRIVVDLGEVRGFDYYSGVRLRVWAPGVARPILRGGRYDRLLAGYGALRPATGFAIDLDALEQALAQTSPRAGARDDAPGHVVAVAEGASSPLRRRASTLAASLRAEGTRAWVQPAISCARAEQLAVAGGAGTLTWIERRAGRLSLQRRIHEHGSWQPHTSWDEDA
jgi:ATP phosphoribosyltransferase regulatory subunit